MRALAPRVVTPALGVTLFVLSVLAVASAAGPATDPLGLRQEKEVAPEASSEVLQAVDAPALWTIPGDPQAQGLVGGAAIGEASDPDASASPGLPTIVGPPANGPEIDGFNPFGPNRKLPSVAITLHRQALGRNDLLAGSFSFAADHGDPCTVRISFGDGSPVEELRETSTGSYPLPAHRYHTAGGFTVKVNVINKWAQVGSAAASLDVDFTPPVTKLTPDPADWTNRAVTVRLVATDEGPGATTTYWRIGSGGVNGYDADDPPRLTEASQTLHYWSVDRAGNDEAAKSFSPMIDADAPEASAAHSPTPGENGWNTGAVSVSLSARDRGGSGVRAVHYSVDGGAERVCAVGDALPLFSEDGTHHVAYWAEDLAGNRGAVAHDFVRIDTTPPATVASLTAASSAGGAASLPAVTVALRGDDTTSGVEATYWRLGDAGVVEYDPAHPPVLTAADGVLSYWSVDGAGNAEPAQTLAPPSLDPSSDPVPSPLPSPTDPGPSPTPTKPASLPGPIFNVLDFGARGDGVADDSPAIGRAFDAADTANGGTVLLPAGRTYLIASGWAMKPIKTNDWLGQTDPTVHRTGTVTVSGYGATVRYARDVGRVGWLQSGWQSSPWTTQGNLVVQGMTIDNNFAESQGEVGRVLWLHDANVENVVVRHVTMKNVTPRTAVGSPSTVCGVFIKENFESPTPGHRAFQRNITITDSSISAQAKPIFIGSDGYGAETYGYGDSPMVTDDIDIERVFTDNNGHLGTGIHLGSFASGGTARVIDVTATNSSDNLIEIDAFNDVTVRGAKLSKAASGIGFTWFSFPYRDTTPVYRIIDSTYGGENRSYWDKRTATEPPASRNAEGTVFVAQSRLNADALLTRSWGDFIMSGCDWTSGAVNPFYSSRPAIQFVGAFRSVTVTDTNITDIDAKNVGGALLQFKQLGATTAGLTIRNVNYRSRGDGPFRPLPSERMSLRGSFSAVP